MEIVNKNPDEVKEREFDLFQSDENNDDTIIGRKKSMKENRNGNIEENRGAQQSFVSEGSETASVDSSETKQNAEKTDVNPGKRRDNEEIEENPEPPTDIW